MQRVVACHQAAGLELAMQAMHACAREKFTDEIARTASRCDLTELLSNHLFLILVNEFP